MSDPDLQRRRREHALPLGEQVTLLNARLRAGDLDASRLLLAAYAGELPAQAALGLPRREEAAQARAEHTKRILAIRWAGVQVQAPDDLFVAEAIDDPVLSRLCPRWEGALVLAANVPEVTGFLLQARSGGALGVTRGRDQRAPTPITEDARREALAAARAQIEAEGLRFEAEDEALQAELLELGDWRAPRTAEVWLASFAFFGPEALLRAELAWARASLERVAPAERSPLEALFAVAEAYVKCPCETCREAAAAALPRAEALVAEASPEGSSAPWRLRAALARAADVSIPAGEGPAEEELALLPERDPITSELATWALASRP